MTLPTTREIMTATGLSSTSARNRILRYAYGQIDEDDLWRPKGHVINPTITRAKALGHSVEEIMAATGLSWSGAAERLRKVGVGLLPAELLLETKQQALARKSAKIAARNRLTGHDKRGEWEGLGTSPRPNTLARIPGSTAWERQNLGQ